MPKLYLKDGRTYEITEDQSWKIVIVMFLKSWHSNITLRGALPFTVDDIVMDKDEINRRNQSVLIDIPATAKKKSRKKVEELA